MICYQCIVMCKMVTGVTGKLKALHLYGLNL